MSSFQPFEPAVKSGVAGFSQQISLGAGAATSQTIQFTNTPGAENPSLLVTLVNPSAAPLNAYIRLSVESSTVIAATVADCAIAASGAGATVRLFASPNPTGTFNVAVIVSATPSTAGFISFCPGQGGLV
jgi:hypothetical protein